QLLGKREERAVSEVVAVDEEELRVARGCVVEVELCAGQRLGHARHNAIVTPPMRVPMLAGTQLMVVSTDDDAVTLRPPPPAEGIADVGAAVRDALRFPLAGPPLEALVPRSGTRATIVVEPPSLPIPGAGGLARRAGHELLGSLVSPEFARRFHGHVEVHDVERGDLVDLDGGARVPHRVHPALVETDVVVIVTAAETVLHGGPASLLG